MKTLFFILLGLSQISFAKSLVKPDWTLVKSDLQYTVSYPLKTVQAHNKEAKGKVHCDKGICEFLEAAEVKKFDSGDTNRDLHMQEVTKAALFPYVTIRGKFPQELAGPTLKTNLEIEFGGEKQTIPNVELALKDVNGDYEVKGHFEISLKQFNMKAPALLGIEIKDKIPIQFMNVWHAP